jgi:plasmid stability protein
MARLRSASASDIGDVIRAVEPAMGQVIIRNLDNAVIETHRRRAKARGVSLEQELRDLLSRAARPSREERLRRIDEIRAMTPELRPGKQRTPGWVLIREDRDSR